MFYNPDKLGYYQVGDFKTYRKFLAIEEHRTCGLPIHWHFNNKEFASVDWKVEPTQTLEELYCNRAKQLRQKYDYLVIFYSGGSDSQTVLDTFLQNNIKIDEIATCWSLKGDGTPDAYFNEEIAKVALPYLEKVKVQHPDIKYRLIDQTDIILNSFSSPDWFVDFNNTLTPNCVTRSQLRDYIPEYQRLIHESTVGFVWGRDKPKIFTDEQGKYYVQFDDFNDNNTSAYSQSRAHLGWYDEFFFHDPDAIELMKKQAHLVVNAMQNNLVNELNNINKIIYPDWNTNTFTNGKNHSQVYGARDAWFFNKYTESNAYKNWLRGIITVQNRYSANSNHRSWLNTNDIKDNIVGLPSPRYYIT